MTTTYSVDGMTCGGCVASVTRALQAAAPDLKFDVSLDDKAVSVDGEHDAKVVEDAVEGAGFDFGGPR